MKTVLITGASRGIGKATAKRFLDEDWKVIGTSTDGNGWEDENIDWVKLDLADDTSIHEAIKDISIFKPIEVLVNNAGTLNDDEEKEDVPINIEVLRSILEVNLIGTINFTEQILKENILADKSHIISLGSRAGALSIITGTHYPEYRISKVGMSMFTRLLAIRLKENNILVSIIDPGWVRTDMGGSDAERDPEIPANEIYDLAIQTDIPTGRFWEAGKQRSW